MTLEETFQAAQGALEELGASWALVGGLAVGARTEPRFTRDVDLAVAVPDDEAAEHLLRQMMDRGYEVLFLVEQTATGRLATARLQHPRASYLVDLLFASCGIEPEVVEAAEPLQVFSETAAPVARVPHLLAMKVLARDDRTREQDRGDVRRLLQVGSAEDLEEARRLLRLIERRSCHRGKDLQAELSRAVAELG